MFLRKIRYVWQVLFCGLTGGYTPPISDNHSFYGRTDHITIENCQIWSTRFLDKIRYSSKKIRYEIQSRKNPVYLEKIPVFLEKNTGLIQLLAKA
jgi:hypothetical protein